MSKRWLAPSIVLLVSLSLFGEASHAYNPQVVTWPTVSRSEVARNPIRIFQRTRNRILGTGWLGRMNRNRVKEWVNGGESGLIYRSTEGSIIGPYRQLSRWTPKNLPGGGNARWNRRNAHHILEAQHARAWGLNENDLPAVNLSRRDHERFHNLLRNEVKTLLRRNQGQPLTKSQVWQVYERVYQAHPDWLDAIRPFFED